MSDFKLTRRKLLTTMALGGSAVAFGGLPHLMRAARASDGIDGPPRYFIFCYFSGGWDILLSLDPRDPDVFSPDRVGETLIQPGYDELNDAGNNGQLVEAGDLVFGPYIGDLAGWVDRLAVVRGMSMETLTHEAGRRRFITGKPPSGLLARGSSASTWFAGLLGEQQLIPNISVNVEAYNKDFAPYASALKVAGVPDLARALSPGDVVLDADRKRVVDQFLNDQSWCPKAQSSSFWIQAEEARLKADEMINNGLDELFDFSSNSPEMVAMRQRYNVATNNLNSANASAAAAVAALTGGISRAVSIRVASGLDTHFDDWTRDQGPRQQAGFDLMAAMADDLDSRSYPDGSGRSWLDVTTIVGFSEFSRTAMLNANTGRDHALTNACVLVGGGIRGNTAVGASSDFGLSPLRTNLETGLLDPAGAVIHPEHVIRSLMVDAGITSDVADLRVPHMPALLA